MIEFSVKKKNVVWFQFWNLPADYLMVTAVRAPMAEGARRIPALTLPLKWGRCEQSIVGLPAARKEAKKGPGTQELEEEQEEQEQEEIVERKSAPVTRIVVNRFLSLSLSLLFFLSFFFGLVLTKEVNGAEIIRPGGFSSAAAGTKERPQV